MKKAILFLLIFILLIQFIPTKHNTNEAAWQKIKEEQNLGDELHTIFSNACYDCHSNNTIYPWYSKIQPLSLWINHHVDEGKHHFNFNSLNEYSPKKFKHKMEELVEMIEKEEMPLKSYTIIHKNAILTNEQQMMIINWAKAKMNSTP